MTDEQPLAIERRGPIVIARLDRPDARNALSPRLMSELGRLVTQMENDAEARVLVLTGTGERAFCSGMDLRAFAESGSVGSDDPESMAGFMRLMSGDDPLPIVGAANATAVAGGLELLLGCDVIVASSEARFGLPEVKRGLIPAGGGVLLGARLPLAIALELNLTGEAMSAERAYEVGLVNAVVAPDQVMATALAFAEKIAANGPLAVATAKELVRKSAADVGDARRRLGEVVPTIFASEDAREGATAFVEKRDPVWRGR